MFTVFVLLAMVLSQVSQAVSAPDVGEFGSATAAAAGALKVPSMVRQARQQLKLSEATTTSLIPLIVWQCVWALPSKPQATLT